MSTFVSGVRDSYADATDHVLEVESSIKFLNPKDNGIRWVKSLLERASGSSHVATGSKYSWLETALAVPKETVTTIINATSVTVANAYGYMVGDILRIENEFYRVTAITNGTTLAVTSGYAGSTSAAHTSKVLYNLGKAAAENAVPGAGFTSTADKKYNYVQTFEMPMEMSADEIAEKSYEAGNPFDAQFERNTLAFMKRMANAVIRGTRYEDSGNKIRLAGGLDFYLTTNVTNVAGALSITNLDAGILASVLVGGNPSRLVMSPARKQKLDALDTNKVYATKAQLTTGGNPIVSQWQSGILETPLDVVIDMSIPDDTVYIIDDSTIEIIPLVSNGVNGRLSVVDATAPGQDGKKSALRGKYTFKFEREAANVKLYGLS
jgi:hypothetical protein